MDYVYVGKMNGSHGLKGELKLKSDFEYTDKIFKKGFTFYVGKNKEEVSFSKVRNHNGTWLITFTGYEDINLIEKFRNQSLYINRDDLELDNNQFVLDDYLNLDCYYESLYLGKVKDVVDCGLNNYVFHIIGDKEILIPLNDKFIEKVILNDKILFKDVEGLIDAN